MCPGPLRDQTQGTVSSKEVFDDLYELSFGGEVRMKN